MITNVTSEINQALIAKISPFGVTNPMVGLTSLYPDQSLATRLISMPSGQYTLRRTTRRGATTTPRRTTGAPTTTAPPAPTHPARTTPRAQTTALASIVLKATKPPASNREIIRCFMTVLLWLHVIRWSYSISARGRSRPPRQWPASSQARFVGRESSPPAGARRRLGSRHPPRSRLRWRIWRAAR
jgi:hypothetical protein